MVGRKISEEDVRQLLAKVKHPAINGSLADLGMIKDEKIRRDEITVMLALPSFGIPIRDHLVNLIREALMKLDVEVDVTITEMNQKEIQAFLAIEHEKWKGLP
jgi:metal-sulfur cluster biosynthetic enzyme